MAAPSNIRINPFTGTGGATNYINLTEVHIIPAASPFVIRLNEVPQKKDPSNMKAFYMDETTGIVTTTALTEVAATPGAGQFRPDYSTNADNDEDWNTGLIEFSSADAGKSVQISYTGMGTLAGVKDNRFPAWWLDRGDGSDGDFIPAANITISGLKQYKRVFIKAGITVTIDKYVRICCQGAFTNLGIISADGRTGNSGFGGTNPSIGKNGTGGGAGGAGGGAGGAGGGGMAGGVGSSIGDVAISAAANLDLLMENKGLSLGAGGGGGRGYDGGGGNRAYGGAGGAGGGAIVILCTQFANKGSIKSIGARGSNGTGDRGTTSGGGGGGGGGTITVIANSVVNQGVMDVKGGTGGSGYNGGAYGAAGGSGLIKIIEIGAM